MERQVTPRLYRGARVEGGIHVDPSPLPYLCAAVHDHVVAKPRSRPDDRPVLRTQFTRGRKECWMCAHEAARGTHHDDAASK
eukprot:5665382-Prymnesium_polylepis.1